MKKTLTIVEDDKMTSSLQAQHDEVQKQVETMPEETRNNVRAAQQEVDRQIALMNEEGFNYDHEARNRAKGLNPKEAEDLALLIKKIRIGQLFDFKNETRVLTPFKTVVSAQLYVDTLQSRLMELSSVEVEIEVAGLKTQVSNFTNLGFVGLIVLAFKRLFQRGKYAQKEN